MRVILQVLNALLAYLCEMRYNNARKGRKGESSKDINFQKMIDSLIVAVTNDQEGGPAGFYGFMGIAAAVIFANLGAAYGTAKSGVGICSMGILKPDKIIKSVIPVIMAGILGIYGLIVAVVLLQKSNLILYLIKHH